MSTWGRGPRLVWDAPLVLKYDNSLSPNANAAQNIGPNFEADASVVLESGGPQSQVPSRHTR